MPEDAIDFPVSSDYLDYFYRNGLTNRHSELYNRENVDKLVDKLEDLNLTLQTLGLTYNHDTKSFSKKKVTRSG